MLSVVGGGFTGFLFPDKMLIIKPFGDILINLIFTAVVPLIFFSISSSIARMKSVSKIGHMMSSMTIIFLFTGSIAAVYAITVVLLVPPAQGITLHLPVNELITHPGLSQQLVSTVTVSNFSQLLSHKHILALIVFSILVGLATAGSKEQGKTFATFLQSGEEVFLKVFSLIMWYAPIGFFAYFAVLVSEIGPKLLENYARLAIIYYVATAFYFFVVFSVYAYLAGKTKGIRLFWGNVFLPAVTSIATCSSAASIPANILATKKMHVPAEICDTVIPLGSLIHKDGSVIGGVFKIAFLFGIFHMDFSGAAVLVTAFGISLMVGTIMGAFPSGGMLGELLILSIYGFPSSVLIAVAAISIIIDPIATLVNVTGNSVSSMMIARMTNGRKWAMEFTYPA